MRTMSTSIPSSPASSTLGFIYGAYMTETFRGAILAVAQGQLEAGRAFGMSGGLVFRRILLPQMMRHALPGFGNNWLVLLKATALMSVIGLDDMLRKAGFAAGATHKPFTFYLAVGLIYLALTIISTVVLVWAERRYSAGFGAPRMIDFGIIGEPAALLPGPRARPSGSSALSLILGLAARPAARRSCACSSQSPASISRSGSTPTAFAARRC